MRKLGYFLALLYVFMNFEALAKKVDRGANKHNPRMNKIFVGEITRNSRFVELDHPLVAIDKDAPARTGLICEFKLTPVNTKDPKVLFGVEIINENEGIISLKPNLNLSDCSINQTELHYYITAYDCGTGEDENGYINQRKSHQSKVSITLKETNLYRPSFSFENISLEFDEDIIAGSPLVSLQASDRDCSSRYGDICGYKISGNGNWDKKFRIVNGVLTSKHLIRSTSNKQVIDLKIQTRDCDSLYSSPTHVRILIQPICNSGWENVQKHSKFNGVMSSVLLYPQSTFKLCVPPHDVATINVDVNLRGTKCLQQLQNDFRICDSADNDIINILPTEENYNQLLSQQHLITPLPILTKISQNEEVYEFNGENEALVFTNNPPFMPLNHLDLTSNYSIFFKIFLPSAPNNTSHAKSTILCKSDASGLSRHHFSVYVQNCHLMLLIRREGGKKGSVVPAEWHWKLYGNQKEGCGNKWYDVLVNVQFPNVTLYFGGNPLTPFLVADDYPLLRSHHPVTWTVGAAWEGRTSELVQHFHGQISGLGISPYLRKPNMTKCVPRCKEGINLIGRVDDAEQIDLFPERKLPGNTFHLSLTGNTIEQMTGLLQTVVYYNSQPITSLLEREISLTTTIVCHNNVTKCPYIPPKVTSLKLTPTSNPQIVIKGKGHVVRSADDIARSSGHGVYLFADISIMSQTNNEFAVGVIGPQQFIDFCTIRETNDLGIGKFHVRPQQILRDYNLEIENQPDSVILKGAQTLVVYENVFQSLMYNNHHATSLIESSFKVTCFKSNGKYHSNEYIVMLEILHPMTNPPPVADDNIVVSLVSSNGLHDGSLISNEGARVSLEAEQADQIGERLFQIGNDPSRKDYATPIIMAGSGIILLTLLVVAGVFHLRLQGGDSESDMKEVEEERVVEEGDLDWDDSAMTITINPMENAAGGSPEASDDDFSELDEDDVSCSHVRETHLIGCKSHDPALLERHIRRPEDYYKWEG